MMVTVGHIIVVQVEHSTHHDTLHSDVVFNLSVVLHTSFGVFQRQTSKLENKCSVMFEFQCCFRFESLIFKMIIYINFVGFAP